MLMEVGSVRSVVSGTIAHDSDLLAENLAVEHLRSDFAVQTLWNEVVSRWGAKAQLAEYRAGEDHGALGCNDHVPDVQGISHALDIRIDLDGDGAGLTIEDGIWLAEYLRGVGRRSNRFAYLIHRGQIAGSFSGWRWVPYRRLNATMDRIHLSTCRSDWGTPPSAGPDIFDSIAPWGVGIN